MRTARLVCAVVLLAACVAGAVSADISLEYAIRAAYLAKFAPFIEWPDSAFATPGAAINICILGSDPFGAALDRAAASVTGGRPLLVRRLASPELASACQILYLANNEAAASLPAGLSERPVVTVSEAGGAGMIAFVVDGNHVRFDIDDDAAQHSGIHISSKLLSLAHAVKHKAAAP
jgi:hypothetical protein